MLTAHRYHDISCGHRVYGHENKCSHLHGHNYRIHFTLEAKGEDDLDSIGRVVDFGVIKSVLCQWLEANWDHRFLIWDRDPWSHRLIEIDPTTMLVPFNPTAENMAYYLGQIKGPTLLKYAGLEYLHIVEVVVEETRKCAASFTPALL